jgi:Fe2+ or Zn2+ uptake regulation protein
VDRSFKPADGPVVSEIASGIAPALAAPRARPGIGASPPASETLCARLRAARLRPTAPRLWIIETLETAPSPMTVEDVFRALDARGAPIGLGTVYRVLAGLVSAKLLLRDWLPGHDKPKAVYSIPPPPAAARAGAHRLVCRRCGRSVTFIDAGLPKRLFRAAGLQDPPGRRQALTVVMECPDCARPASDEGQPAACASSATRSRRDTASAWNEPPGPDRTDQRPELPKPAFPHWG